MSACDQYDKDGHQELSKSYQYFVDQNMRLQQENHRYGVVISQLQSELSQCYIQCSKQESTIRSLQQQLIDQQCTFDRKFSEFLQCANDYDQRKSKQINHLHSNLQQLSSTLSSLQRKYDDLHCEHCKLQSLYAHLEHENMYKSWKWHDVFKWITSTLHDARLAKYEQILYDNLKSQDITGCVLASLNEDDLYDLGIDDYFDRELLCQYIQQLVTVKPAAPALALFAAADQDHMNRTEQPPPNIAAHHSTALQPPQQQQTQQPPQQQQANINTAAGEIGSALMHHKHFSVAQLKEIRIRQKNIVYVVGLPVSLCNAKLLKSSKWFGKYGTISRICFNTSPKCVKANSIPTFVTYTNEEDAWQAIEKMNLYCLSDGTRLKTNYGRTKYCPAFCESKQCRNAKCKYLHEWADFDDIITEQEINDFNAIKAGPPSSFNKKQ